MTLDAPTIEIQTETSTSPEARELISASQAEMELLYPPDEIFSLSPEELAAPNAQFIVARLDDTPVGCIALIDMFRYGEIKRLFVTRSARGLGLGRTLVEEVENAARDIGLTTLRLETGPNLETAMALYQRLGYRMCGAFGNYEDRDCSVFMEKSLS